MNNYNIMDTMMNKIIISCLFSINMLFAQSNLLAPVYPGSKLSPLRSDKTQSVYLSKAPIKKIESFYSPKVGKLSRKDPLTNSYYIESLNNIPVTAYGKTIITANQISRQEGYPDPDAKDAGVLLLAKKSSAQESSDNEPANTNAASEGSNNSGSDMQAEIEQMQKKLMKEIGNQNYSKEDVAISEMSDIFDGLKNEIYLQHHSKKELIAVYNKYKYLETSFYVLIKNKNGEKVSYAKYLLKQYKNKLGNSNLTSDHWNYWMGFLRELAGHAYKTCIIINTNPKIRHK